MEFLTGTGARSRSVLSGPALFVEIKFASDNPAPRAPGTPSGQKPRLLAPTELTSHLPLIR